MSRKHFQAIAAAMREQKPADNWDANKKVQWALDVNALASACNRFNPAFDRQRFLTACGLEA